MTNTALQLYTLRKELEEDFEGTLHQVSRMGYRGIELAGNTGGMSAEALHVFLKQIHLETASMHVSLEELETNSSYHIDFAHALGCRHIVCPYLEPEKRRSIQQYKELAASLNRIGETCRKEGITFSYHNHDFELVALEGELPLSVIMENTDPKLVMIELDTYWVQKAGEDPLVWMDRCKNRMQLVHLKDMTRDEEGFFAELGTGRMDIEAILKQAKQQEVAWQIVEQDESRGEPIESVKESLQYLHQLSI
ncbi:sugar phosphate isomerase/epimerase [Sinobaca qinghaiensis]|uniref:Sugar phosphate isomerase/epimerase n=1 Tax=Sinobaca qinghaiensis TaxID=342944 RepID=A0A419UWD2_9BACL|nr:sugar phosphate isomerase/epimerase [Sinobaca qinghaiensis]RKD69437.1 sugar phosphate isomerase/epimerase [Sinobaca qinghaiensis]